VIRRPRPARRPGLSLLEILLSLAIFLMSLVAIGGLVESGSDRGMSAALQAAGTRLAQSKLAEVEAGAIPVSSGGQGTFDDEPEWNWSVEPGAAAVPNVYPVTVRVWREFGGGQFEVVLTQMIFDPAQMGDASEAPKPTTTESGTTTSGGTGS
jgi:general secretion pathway protein I